MKAHGQRVILWGLPALCGLGALGAYLYSFRGSPKPRGGTGFNLGTGETQIIPPPPDAVWLKQSPEAYGPEPAPGGSAGGNAAGGAPAGGSVSQDTGAGGVAGFAVYLTGSSQLLELDAGKFLESRFRPLPLAQRPTTSQLGVIYSTFTALGVDARGKLRTRPPYEATETAMNIAAAWDAQHVPAPVGQAVRDFARMAWEQLPANVETKTA